MPALKRYRRKFKPSRSTAVYRSSITARQRKHRITKVNKGLVAKPGFGTVRSPFPPNLWTTFTYTETIKLQQAVAGVPQAYGFRANSLYDPNLSGTGHQPRYMDTLCGPDGGTAPYRNYRVHASKISIKIWQDNSVNALVTVIPQRAATANPTSLDEMRERPYGRHRAITQISGWKPYTLNNFCKIKNHLGHKDLMDVDSTAASYNANPTEGVTWLINTCAVDPLTTSSVVLQVTVTYFAQLYTLADVADS